MSYSQLCDKLKDAKRVMDATGVSPLIRNFEHQSMRFKNTA